MKTIIFSALIVFVSFFQTAWATTTHYETITFKVSGNCTMCKNRIESALKANTAVQQATWDSDTKIVTVVYNPHVISSGQLHQLVADAGHDTEKVHAADAAYKSIPKCCQYNNNSDKHCCAKKCCKKKACVKDCCTAECTTDKACTSECCKASCCK